MNRPTNGAYLLAKVYHDAYQQAELEEGRIPIAAWSSLPLHDRVVMARGFQKMLDLGIIQSIGLGGFRKLREAGWQSAVSSREKAMRPGSSDLVPREQGGGEENGGEG